MPAAGSDPSPLIFRPLKVDPKWPSMAALYVAEIKLGWLVTTTGSVTFIPDIGHTMQWVYEEEKT